MTIEMTATLFVTAEDDAAVDAIVAAMRKAGGKGAYIWEKDRFEVEVAK